MTQPTDTGDEGARAYRFLAERDPVLAALTRTHGHPDPYAWHDGGRTGTSLFAALLLHVVGQRVSAAAAFTVYDRIAQATGGGVPNPGAVLALRAEGLRVLGTTGGKADCAVALARHQVERTMPLDDLRGLDDDAVIRALTSVKGLGAWSAQAFLMRQLHRPDVLPATDSQLRRAVQAHWALATAPTHGQLRERAQAWSPHRSHAAALLWASLHPPDEPFDPKERALAALAARQARP